MKWIKTEDEKPSNNEEVLTYHVDHKDWAIMTYEESTEGDYYSFVEEGEIYYPEFWVRLTTPKTNPVVMKNTRSG
jgi:hypothetical protein